MSVETILTYRIRCDTDGCDVASGDGLTVESWTDVDGAVYDALNGGWCMEEGVDLCPAHWAWHDQCEWEGCQECEGKGWVRLVGDTVGRGEDTVHK